MTGHEITIAGKIYHVTVDGFGITYIDGKTIDDFVSSADQETVNELISTGIKLMQDEPEHFKDIVKRYEVTELDPYVDGEELPVWESSDGKTKLIANMPTKYIFNCILKVEKELANKPRREIYISDAPYTPAEDDEDGEADVIDPARQKELLIKKRQLEAELRKRGDLPPE